VSEAPGFHQSEVLATSRAGIATDQNIEVLPSGLVRRAVATLDPGYFALVMATGIISIGAGLVGYSTLSQIILVLTSVAFVVLVVAYTARLVWFRRRVGRDLRTPTMSVAYFTSAAGCDVLATRLVTAGHVNVALGLGVAAAAVWLALTYWLPWSIVASTRHPVLADMNGSWLIWVVATQSLAIIAAAVAPHAPSTWLRDYLPVVAICFWAVGVMLYLILIAIVFLRLLLVEFSPAQMVPAYWIAMGATAITVRAAAGILVLHLPATASLVSELRPFLLGVSVVLWAFGTWWIPLLILFGVWRYLIRHYSRAYEPRLWNVVFPLGMYTVASWSLGHAAAGLDFMTSMARVWFWVGFAAWIIVVALMALALWRAVRGNNSTTTELAGGGVVGTE
jgi:tellurite resistance protein TehA-like permease